MILTPEQYGAVAGTNCDTAFQKLMADVDASLKTDAGGSVPVSRATVQLGEGPYILTKPLMVEKSGRAQGLTIRGMAKRASEIVWSGPGALLTNKDRWMGVTFENLSFRCTDPTAAFLYSWSTGANQDWNFVRCEWRGKWAYGIGLDGPTASNTNSEWVFDRCTVTGSYENAWLWSGMSPQYPQQDQFLNFSLRDCKIEHQYGDALRFDKGGSITVSGGSWILTGSRPTGAKSRFFYFPPTSHFDSVQNLTVTGVRFELRSVASQVIDSSWNGQIQFIGCMDDALAFQAWAPGHVAHQYRDSGGVLYQGCSFLGKHGYDASKTPSRQVAVYTSCARKNNRSAASFLVKSGAQAAALKFAYVADRDGLV